MNYQPSYQPNDAIFHDKKLSPAEINRLLGIRVSLDMQKQHEESENNASGYYTRVLLRVASVTLFITVTLTTLAMYQLEVGPFYNTDTLAEAE